MSTIKARRAVRGYLANPVPLDKLRAAFDEAQHAASNCNVQPWRAYVATAATRDKYRSAMLNAFDQGEFEQPVDPIDSFAASYRDLQVACAVEMYGAMGIARDDYGGRARAHRRNFELFDAPHVAIICMHETFGLGVAIDVGIYLQSLMLALWDRGIASCPMAALRSYSTLARDHLAIPDDERILCGLVFGYEDPDVPANATRQKRDQIDNNVFWRSE